MQRDAMASMGIYVREIISSSNQERKSGENLMARLSCATAWPPLDKAIFRTPKA
jgi:hypothetical protein